MSDQHKAYIAGIGMITPVGANAAMTVASVNAGISAYKISRHFNQQEYPITMASVPEEIFSSFDDEIISGRNYSGQYDHIIKMAMLALKETIARINIKNSIPLVFATPEKKDNYIPLELLLTNLLKRKDIPLDENSLRFISTGRDACIQGLSAAMEYLYKEGNEFVLLGSSDSYFNASRIYDLDTTERLLAKNRQDGFAAGEGAGFILLTKNKAKAVFNEGKCISISQPGIGEESGNFYNDSPYKGEGLSSAFSQVLSKHKEKNISTIYSSMNGEHYWAKEYGVAVLRNKKYFKEDFETEHPADCFGDLGSATGSVLLGISAMNLLNSKTKTPVLVYSSSDGAGRSAVLVELENSKRH